MHVVLSACLGLVDLLVVCGNIFVLYLLASQPSLRSSTNSLVLSLTLSDLLLGLLILPFSIMQEHHDAWLFGEVSCRIWLSLDVFFSTASIYSLLAISLDRYMAVRQPIRYPIISSERFVRQMIAVVWASSLGLSLLLLLVERNTEESPICSPLSFPDPFIIASATASFIAPAVFMIVLNLMIFKRVHSSRRSKSFYVKRQSGGSLRIHRGAGNKAVLMKQPSRSESAKSDEWKSTSPTNEMMAEKRPSRDDGDSAWPAKGHINSAHVRTLFSNLLVVSLAHTKKRAELVSLQKTRGMAPSLRTELRVARTTFIVVAAFVVCWFPFMTIYLLQTYQLCPFEKCVPGWLFTTTFWLGYANSALNPILYAAFSRDFRRAFRRVLLGRPR